MKASDCKCCECGKQAVAFWPVYEPDIPSYPYCRACLDKAKMELAYKLWGDNPVMMAIAKKILTKTRTEMKAKVIKTGEVVTLTDKQGVYYLDSNNNPYKEDELEFGVIDDTITPTDPVMPLVKMLQHNQQQLLMVPALTFATEVVKAKPNMTAAGVAEYVATVITKLRQVL